MTSWQLDAQGRTLPKLVHREFDDYLKCGRLEHGFLRVRCSDCHAEKLLAFSCKRLERRELLVRDAENSHLDFEPSAEGDGLADLQSHSITYRIALGAQRRRKAFTLQSLPPAAAADSTDRVAQCAGFSLHAGVAAEDSQREKLERLCRYISRPAVSIERLSRLADGRIRYALKTPYRDGTTHVLFEPLDFLARLAALVPSPGVNLTRYHGVFASNHRLRAQI